MDKMNSKITYGDYKQYIIYFFNNIVYTLRRKKVHSNPGYGQVLVMVLVPNLSICSLLCRKGKVFSSK